MNEIPPQHDAADEVDEAYRRASAVDASRPSDATRRAVLDYSARLAAERTATRTPAPVDAARAAAKRGWRRPAIFGTLAAAALAGLLITPQFLNPRGPATSPPLVADRATALPGTQGAAVPTAPRLQASNSARSAPAAQPEPGREVSPPRQALPEAWPVAQAPAAPAGGAAAKASAEAKAETEPEADAARVAVTNGTATAETAVSAAAVAARPAAAAAPPPAADFMRRAARLADSHSALWDAAAAGDVAALRAALAATRDVDARDPMGRTALMLATLGGRADAVDVLLAHGADPNAVDAQGATPLQAAAAGGQRRIIDALQRAGAR